jgi:hypothetical protein
MLLSEAQIQEQAVKLLRLFGRQDICWWACPNGDWRTPRSGARLKRQGVRPGASDLMLMIDRVFHGLEIKAQKGTQTDSQKSFERDLARAGGVYHLAYGLEETLVVLTDIDAFPAGTQVLNSGKRTRALAQLA